MVTFTIEVPFPTDLAPYKVIRIGESGERRIVDSAFTELRAELLKRRWELIEAQWDEPLHLQEAK